MTHDAQGEYCDVCKQEGHKPYVKVLVGVGPNGAIIETWPRRKLELRERATNPRTVKDKTRRLFRWAHVRRTR